jgi:hypothetical protein
VLHDRLASLRDAPKAEREAVLARVIAKALG